MINIVIKPNSELRNGKWIPSGMIGFPSGPTLTERAETYDKVELDTKEEADRYFMQASKKRYKVAEQNL